MGTFKLETPIQKEIYKVLIDHIKTTRKEEFIYMYIHIQIYNIYTQVDSYTWIKKKIPILKRLSPIHNKQIINNFFWKKKICICNQIIN